VQNAAKPDPGAHQFTVWLSLTPCSRKPVPSSIVSRWSPVLPIDHARTAEIGLPSSPGRYGANLSLSLGLREDKLAEDVALEEVVDDSDAKAKAATT
jgi:hypothetical protein